MNIGSLAIPHPVFLAPLAGVTDLAFRTVVRSFGCGLAFTEMVSARGLLTGGKTCRYLVSSAADRPLGVQLFGSDPETLAAAAEIVAERGAELIDVNMGCPVKKVVKTGSGAALMRDPERVGRIVSALRRATRLPLTVKIRAGWRPREINCLEIGRIAEANGADAVILHPRTADQGFGGVSDWRLIACLKGQLKVPVIGNGDVHTPEDGLRMLGETGCDGVMVGRGALGNPWLIGRIVARLLGGDLPEPTLAEREAVIRQHLALAVGCTGEKIATRDFRKHLLWYTKGLRGGAQFRQRVGTIHDQEAVWEALADYFRTLAHAADPASLAEPTL